MVMNVQLGRVEAAAKSGLVGASLELMEHFAASLAHVRTPWLMDLRETAAARFAVLGLPSRRVEEWKYSDLRSVMTTAFPPASAKAELTEAELLDALGGLAGIDAHRIVFVNGFHSPSLSGADLPEGVEILSIEQLRRLPDWARPGFGALTAQQNDVIGALNLMFMNGGALIRIGRGHRLAKPIHLIHVAAGNRAQFVATRSLIMAEADAEATIVETHHSLLGAKAQTCAVTEVLLEDAAGITHVKLLDDSRAVLHLGGVKAELGENANYHAIQVATGGAFSRNETHVRYAGEGARAHFSGAQMLRGREHCDMTLVIDHAAPSCESREHVKAVLDEEAQGVFQAKVIVRPGAQKTDGRQMAQALMLSDASEFDAKPELEIYADDVKCNHGATVGQIDEEMLFYLRARGIEEKEARALLVRAFIGEILDRIEHEPLRDAVEGKAAAWLAA